MKTVPVHLIAGPLGVGKTTAIRHLLAENPRDEFVAVVVNDFGKAGVYSAVLNGSGDDSSLEVVNVPGGCLCCTSAAGFEKAFQEVATWPKIDRIIIEPSGIVFLDRTVEFILREAQLSPIELRGVTVLFNPPQINKAYKGQLPYYRHLIEYADILVANRSDCAHSTELETFCGWAEALDKQAVFTTSFGRLPFDILDIPSAHVSEALPQIEHQHRKHALQSGGARWAPDVQVDEPALLALLDRLCLLDGTVRFKALLPSGDQWKLFEVAQGTVHTQPMKPQAEAVVDWIFGRELGLDGFAEELNACCMSASF